VPRRPSSRSKDRCRFPQPYPSNPHYDRTSERFAPCRRWELPGQCYELKSSLRNDFPRQLPLPFRRRMSIWPHYRETEREPSKNRKDDSDQITTSNQFGIGGDHTSSNNDTLSAKFFYSQPDEIGASAVKCGAEALSTRTLSQFNSSGQMSPLSRCSPL